MQHISHGALNVDGPNPNNLVYSDNFALELCDRFRNEPTSLAINAGRLAKADEHLVVKC